MKWISFVLLFTLLFSSFAFAGKDDDVLGRVLQEQFARIETPRVKQAALDGGMRYGTNTAIFGGALLAVFSLTAVMNQKKFSQLNVQKWCFASTVGAVSAIAGVNLQENYDH